MVRVALLQPLSPHCQRHQTERGRAAEHGERGSNQNTPQQQVHTGGWLPAKQKPQFRADPKRNACERESTGPGSHRFQPRK